MRVAIAAETAEGERRVAAVPETVRRLTSAGWDVAVERGAGRGAFVSDQQYVDAGAEVVDDRQRLLRATDVLLAVQPPPLDAIEALPAGATVLSPLTFATAEQRDVHLRACRDRRLVVFALERVPRTSRAQSMDVLSSQATVAGYRGALLAAERLPGFFPGLTTAAGTLAPARVLVLGTGVAGLQAIATARRLGATVSGVDIRPSSAEEVESLGATFLPLGPEDGQEQPDQEQPDQEQPFQESGQAGGYARVVSDDVLEAQRRLLAAPVAEADAVIATAAVPGRPAPLLITAGMVERMRPGSVVVDLAAGTGGNCALTRPGEDVEHAGVVVLGPRNAPSELPRHASELFAANVTTLLLSMTREGVLAPDFRDGVLVGCCVSRGGELVRPAAPEAGAEPTDRAQPSPRDSTRQGTVDAVADLLADSRRVVVVPGYGLAAARAHHALAELVSLLAAGDVGVVVAVHPVAGRMPGQLNVVLDAADVPHDLLRGLDEANAALSDADVALLVGANDTVNPAAREPGSPLSGMPVVEAATARRVVALLPDAGPGFAGVDNALLGDEGTTVLFGDARDSLIALLAALRSRRGSAHAQ